MARPPLAGEHGSRLGLLDHWGVRSRCLLSGGLRDRGLGDEGLGHGRQDWRERLWRGRRCHRRGCHGRLYPGRSDHSRRRTDRSGPGHLHRLWGRSPIRLRWPGGWCFRRHGPRRGGPGGGGGPDSLGGSRRRDRLRRSGLPLQFRRLRLGGGGPRGRFDVRGAVSQLWDFDVRAIGKGRTTEVTSRSRARVQATPAACDLAGLVDALLHDDNRTGALVLPHRGGFGKRSAGLYSPEGGKAGSTGLVRIRVVGQFD
jgi:hypothetical protein